MPQRKELLHRAIAAIRRRGPRNHAPTTELDVDTALEMDLVELYRAIAASGSGAERPQYVWPLLRAARDAQALRIPEIAACEFGVAAGRGLLALEEIAGIVGQATGVEIRVFGFDTGAGLPPPRDHRDVPFSFEPGHFAMDVDALRGRLSSAELVLGDVADSVSPWLDAGPPPVGFVSFDLDYYSSTTDAMTLFDASTDRCLPRVVCYFDDVFGYKYGDHNGARLAISDFNDAHERRKLSEIHGLRYHLPRSEYFEPWHQKLWVLHVFDHPRYGDSTRLRQPDHREYSSLAPARR